MLATSQNNYQTEVLVSAGSMALLSFLSSGPRIAACDRIVTDLLHHSVFSGFVHLPTVQKYG